MKNKARIVSIAVLALLVLGFAGLSLIYSSRNKPAGMGMPGAGLSPGAPAAGGSAGAPAAGMPAQGGTPPAQGLPGVPGDAAKTEETIFSVRLEAVKLERLQQFVDLGGDIATETNVEVLSESAGKLVSVRAVLGQKVRAGELLAEVDPSKPGSNYAISPIYSPISGTITAVPAQIGATVGTATTIAKVGIMDQLKVQVKVPERHIGLLAKGLSAKVSVEAYPEENFAAVLSSLDPVVDSVSRTKTIILHFLRSDARLNAGMYARVRLFANPRSAALTIPETAVVTHEGVPSVYTVAADSDRVRLQEVHTGVAVDGRIEITSGLKAGDQVVVKGQERLDNGSKITVVADTQAVAK